MASPIYFFTRSGCAWCKKMQPSIEQINNTLSDEQKIQIHNTDEEKSKSIYNSIITRYKLKRIVPLLYNSNIGTYLLGYQDKKNVQQFLKANPLKERKPLTPMPKFDIDKSTKKDFGKWKKDVILWYGKNKLLTAVRSWSEIPKYIPPCDAYKKIARVRRGIQNSR